MGLNDSYFGMMKGIRDFQSSMSWKLGPDFSKALPRSLPDRVMDLEKMASAWQWKDPLRNSITNMALSLDAARTSSVLGKFGLNSSLADMAMSLDTARTASVLGKSGLNFALMDLEKSLLGGVPKVSTLTADLDVSIADHPFKSLRTYKSFFDNVSNSPSSLADMASRLSGFSKNISEEDIEYTDDDTIIYDGEEFTFEDLEDGIEELSSNYALFQGDSSTVDETTQAAIRDISATEGEEGKRKRAALKWLLGAITTVIVGLLIAFFTPPVTELSKQVFGLAPREAVKQIQKTAICQTEDREALKKFRIVKASVLNVREKPNRKSRKVGQLYFGYVVELIEKRKNWALVEFKNDDEIVVLRGWVSNRYLKKLLR